LFIKNNIFYKLTNFFNNYLFTKILLLINVKILNLKLYLKLKFLKFIHYKLKYYIINSLNYLTINYIIKRLNILKFVYFLKFKFNNLIQFFFINQFIYKFIIILSLFLKPINFIFIIFKQLNKNINSKALINFKKPNLIFNILKIRKFETLAGFKITVNFIYNIIKLKSKSHLITQFLNIKLPNIKNTSFFFKFIKFINLVVNQFFIKYNTIVGFKLILNGNINKNKQFFNTIINLGKNSTNLKINNNLDYNKLTFFTSKGTFGIKLLIYNK
jgi:hypothetical protein